MLIHFDRCSKPENITEFINRFFPDKEQVLDVYLVGRRDRFMNEHSKNIRQALLESELISDNNITKILTELKKHKNLNSHN